MLNLEDCTPCHYFLCFDLEGCRLLYLKFALELGCYVCFYLDFVRYLYHFLDFCSDSMNCGDFTTNLESWSIPSP